MITCDICKKETRSCDLFPLREAYVRPGVQEVCSGCEKVMSDIIIDVKGKHARAASDEIAVKLDELIERNREGLSDG